MGGGNSDASGEWLKDEPAKKLVVVLLRLLLPLNLCFFGGKSIVGDGWYSKAVYKSGGVLISVLKIGLKTWNQLIFQ